MKMRILICLPLLFCALLLTSFDLYNQSRYQKHSTLDKGYVLKRINEIRVNGCKCGKKRMKPVEALTWNNLLEKSAFLYAKEMNRYDNFSHHSVKDLDVGVRVDKVGYKWQNVGENLGRGQTSYEETLEDWLESSSHCKMLMNPDMKEMGLARVGNYWVHHFGSLMPPKTRRVSTKYSEGE